MGSEEINIVCCDDDIKSRILRWAGHVARMEEGRSALKISIDWLNLKKTYI